MISSAHKAIQYGAVLVLAFSVAWTSIDIRSMPRKLVVGVLIIVLTGLLSLTLAFRGVLFEPFSAMIAGLLSLTGGMLFSVSASGRAAGRVRHFLGL